MVVTGRARSLCGLGVKVVRLESMRPCAGSTSIAPTDVRWDSSFSPRGAGGPVLALIDGGETVYAGGDFTTAGVTVANHVAAWNGASWTPLGSGVDGPDSALAWDGTNLHVGGTFTSVGGALHVPMVANLEGQCVVHQQPGPREAGGRRA